MCRFRCLRETNLLAFPRFEDVLHQIIEILTRLELLGESSGHDRGSRIRDGIDVILQNLERLGLSQITKNKLFVVLGNSDSSVDRSLKRQNRNLSKIFIDPL